MYKRIVMIVCCMLLLSTSVYSHHKLGHISKDIGVVEQLLKSSVTVVVGTGYSSVSGSGTIVTRMEDGEAINFIWTAGHVVQSLRKERTVINPATGTKRTIVEFDDVNIVQEFRTGGRTVGEFKMFARVIRYSNAKDGEDLALLELRYRDFIKTSVNFYLEDDIPAVGSDLLHVGSLLGQMGSNSLTSGKLSQHGRMRNNKEYDQTTVTAFPGSSGGGVYLEDGLYIGMLTKASGETFNLIIPIRRIRKWAARADVMWALDPSVPLPSYEERLAINVEDIGHKFTNSLIEVKVDALPKL